MKKLAAFITTFLLVLCQPSEANTSRKVEAATITNGSASLTVPTTTDTLVGRATTDTLTNKTLTSPSITTPTGIVKGDVGLGNVDNTSDATKNSATAVLTNKDIDGGTASNSNRITLPKAAKATLDGLTRKSGTVMYATDDGVPYYDNGSTLTAMTAGTAISCQYYHDSTCSWSRTNTSYGDPTADSTCAFTQRSNNNCGTVTSYLSGSDKLPGIVFTPTVTAYYEICADTQAESAGTPNISFKMTDGTNTWAERGYEISSANNLIPFTICGIQSLTGATPYSVRIQTSSSSSTSVISTNSSAGVAIEWRIKKL